MGTLPASDFGIDTLAAKLANAMAAQAGYTNNLAETNFKIAWDNWQQNDLIRQGIGLPREPPPTPPQMRVVNVPFIQAIEAGKPVPPGADIYTTYTYVYIPPPAKPLHPDLVINEAGDPNYPGLFQAMPGTDGPWIPMFQPHPQNGHEYVKIAVGQNPFDAGQGGFITRWQMTK